MLAQLKTVVLFRETIKLAFLWASWVSGASAFVGLIILSKWPEKDNFLLKLRQSILVLRNEGYSMREIAKKLKIFYNCVLLPSENSTNGSNQNRKRSGRHRCTTKQEDKYIMRNRLTGPQLAASLNGTRKMPVSMSTVMSQCLNPIELLWEQLDRMVCKKSPSSQSNLWEVLQEAWGEIYSDYLNKLTARMPKVCKAVMENAYG